MAKYIIILFILLSSVPAFAQNKSPYEVDPIIEVPVTIGGFTAFGISRLFSSEFGSAHCGLQCNPNDVNPLDRNVIGKHSGSARAVSDGFFFGGMGLPFAAGVINELVYNTEDGWYGFGADTLVLVETLAFTLTLNNLLDIAVRRPRPLVYDTNVSDKERLHPNSAFSFPSGHTVAVFAMGTAYSHLYMKRHPNSPWIIPIWISSYAAGATTGITRVLAGEHFWTDVIAGAGLGIASGLFIPWLHEAEEASNVAVTPIISPETQGLTITMR